ncbi:hypothetical protein BDZ89DRAFT_1012717 [Hymenopellis radicata]|nr:hypothetical protein BDZ89DRAFT_1012717 [Hymenopellis radicata]
MQRHAYTYAKTALPITSHEFSTAFLKCEPPTGWRHSLAVSNSGGPDSTCLLFMIKRHIEEHSEAEPGRVVSLSINHNLQPASKAMADGAARGAAGMGVQHINKSISWNTNDFPDYPVTAAENMSRLARYQLLSAGMRDTGCRIIALGHHMDDQVETSLIRLLKNTTAYGAAGMKPVRRWGMGISEKYGSLGWTGLDGMNSWIIRPLLGFSKDRLLATCDHNKLEYVVDPTNFVPSYTLRNSIRDYLASNTKTVDVGVNFMQLRFAHSAHQSLLQEFVKQTNLPGTFSVDLRRIRETLPKGQSDFREAVRELGAQAARIDSEVDSWIQRCKTSSPIVGTFLMSGETFRRVPEQLRTHVITRILRYVSPYPWGSLRSMSKRRSDSLRIIETNLLNTSPTSTRFIAGSGVLWTPVVLRDKNFKNLSEANTRTSRYEKPVYGWLASRQRPTSAMSEADNPTIVDVTTRIRECLAKSTPNARPLVFDYLYDCRFLVRFSLSQIPADMRAALETHSLWIKGSSRSYTPVVVLKSTDGDGERVVHSAVSVDRRTLLPDEVTMTGRKDSVDARWISSIWIRHLTG